MVGRHWKGVGVFKTLRKPQGVRNLGATAEGVFARQYLQPALQAYMRANNAEFPTDLSQLQPFFRSPLDDALLQRWQILPAADFPGVGDVDSQSVLTQKAAVDEEYDTCAILGPTGSAWAEFKIQNAMQTLAPVFQACSVAKGGDYFPVNETGQIDLTLLRPYVHPPPPSKLRWKC